MRLLWIGLLCLPLLASDYRWSGGKLYNIQKSTNWVRVTATTIEYQTNLMTCYRVVVRNKALVDQPIAVLNFPARSFQGDKISQVMMRIGETNLNGQIVELWDCGTTNQPTPPKIQAPAKRTEPSP